MTEAAAVTPPHLGGYADGGDPATWYPRLWRDLVRKHGVTSMIDVGAGQGFTVEFFAALGVKAIGVEGTAQDNPRLIRHDYTEGPYDPGRQYDLGWCCEFAEHVEARYEENWLSTLGCCDVVLFTHGDPGQPGHHHVNLHYGPYWSDAFRAYDLVYDDKLTVETRRLAAVGNPHPLNHYARSGLAFRKEGLDR